MKKIFVMLTGIIFVLSTNVQAMTDYVSSKTDKRAYTIILVLMFILLLNLGKRFYKAESRRKLTKEASEEELEILKKYKRQNILYRIIFAMLLYILFMMFCGCIFLTSVYCIEGFGISTTEIPVLSPVFGVKDHFIDTVIMWFVVHLVISGVRMTMFMRAVGNKKYTLEEKKILAKYIVGNKN